MIHNMKNRLVLFLAVSFIASFIALFGAGAAWAADDPLAEGIYKAHCAQCHQQVGEARIPALATLQQLTPAAVNRALEFGAMKSQGASITRAERQALAAWIGHGRSSAATESSTANRCAASPELRAADSLAALSSWGGSLNNWRYADQAAAGLNAADVPKLRLKWADRKSTRLNSSHRH